MVGCRNCEEPDQVMVKDLRLSEAVWRSGNPYQCWCAECNSFKHAVSREDYYEAEEKHIKFPESDEPERLENEFDCPECGRHLYQFPDECRNCGVDYEWRP